MQHRKGKDAAAPMVMLMVLDSTTPTPRLPSPMDAMLPNEAHSVPSSDRPSPVRMR